MAHHISQILDKTASNIVKELVQHVQEDDYHRNIREAAEYLVKGLQFDWWYKTQWSSGTTLWISPAGDDIKTISRTMLKVAKKF